jgi:CheY-like chemotaxis protein
MACLLADAFDVLLSDIAMPDRDGIAFIRDIRGLADVKKRRIPAVALTAFAGAEPRERVLAAGFHRFVAKPVTADQLVSCVNAAIDDAIQTEFA